MALLIHKMSIVILGPRISDFSPLTYRAITIYQPSNKLQSLISKLATILAIISCTSGLLWLLGDPGIEGTLSEISMSVVCSTSRMSVRYSVVDSGVSGRGLALGGGVIPATRERIGVSAL